MQLDHLIQNTDMFYFTLFTFWCVLFSVTRVIYDDFFEVTKHTHCDIIFSLSNLNALCKEGQKIKFLPLNHKYAIFEVHEDLLFNWRMRTVICILCSHLYWTPVYRHYIGCVWYACLHTCFRRYLLLQHGHGYFHPQPDMKEWDKGTCCNVTSTEHGGEWWCKLI